MKQSGITTDGRPVIAGIFSLVGTYGIPLELILSVLQRQEYIIDWPDYISNALQDGHKPRTIRARILSAVGDVYGPLHRAEIEAHLDCILHA